MEYQDNVNLNALNWRTTIEFESSNHGPTTGENDNKDKRQRNRKER